jgi:tellurite resistance protein TerC
MTQAEMWAVFLGLAAALLVLDLGVFNRGEREIGVRASLLQSGFYMAVAGLFGVFLAFQSGGKAALDFYTGYVTEFSLSMDNIFVIALILGMMQIPRSLQHRVLFYGVLGVMVLRGLLIWSGAVMVEQYHWTLYVMAAFLVLTGVQMLLPGKGKNPLKLGNPVVGWFRKRFKVTNELHGRHFVVRLADPGSGAGAGGGRKATYITPLLLALIMVEVVDVLFAFDSVPAIFAITTDPFVVFSSNVFAILGLRSLYFALSAVLQRFTYMKYALALLLVFIGGKVLVAEAWLAVDFPAWLSLLVTGLILASGIFYSMWKTRRVSAKAV